MRLFALVLALSACTHYVAAPAQPSAPKAIKPDPATAQAKKERNFVCESFAAVNDKAACVPEMTDAGERHTHTARVTLDQQIIRCALNDATASVVCSPLIYFPPPEPETQPSKAKSRGRR